jgi:hypothetical protein
LGIDALLDDFASRYIEAFQSRPSLLNQDSGCCNIRVWEGGLVVYDWADVVVGHPVFSCDRLLDQAPADTRESVIAAFCEPLGLGRPEFDAMRRSNVLHEVIRYHDELAHLARDAPLHAALTGAIQRQLRVLVSYENARRA